MCRFHWKKNSIAFWDNIATVHRGIYADLPGFDEQPRIMHRVAITETDYPN